MTNTFTQEGQGHGGVLQTSKGRTDPETKVRLESGSRWKSGLAWGYGGRGLGDRTELDIGISAYRGFGIVAWWW